jgi:hypothetical protein
MDLIKPEDKEIYDFAYSIINFGKYRLFNYLSVYSIDSKYLYSLLKSKIYTKKIYYMIFCNYWNLEKVNYIIKLMMMMMK